MKIYIVEGRTGEYDDRCDWPVKAFQARRKARNLVSKLNKKAQELGVNDRHDYELREDAEKQLRTFDPGARIDYTGVEYSMYELELE